ncbi:hypothetical protein BGZ99_001653 [Dissophora globulifera]|uniref:Thioredoxin domain-containing protein n=1 Tax=Dissophora globulifera TaxID=979702 RepID=A0A9P6UXZ0_9FUNG|nr:hypothetical protein BGZ99_001653 [Dissophora globulifera]
MQGKHIFFSGIAMLLTLAASAVAEGVHALTPETFDSVIESKRFDVREYPTIKSFSDGISSSPEDYAGEWEILSPKSFATKKSGVKAFGRNSAVVEVLTDRNFRQKVGKDGRAYFVEFYAPWCPHCKALAPTWEKVGRNFYKDNNVVIAKVDATKETKTAERYNVDGYPTIIYFDADGNDQEYEGERGEDDFVEFVNDLAGTQRPAGGRRSREAGRNKKLHKIV